MASSTILKHGSTQCSTYQSNPSFLRTILIPHTSCLHLTHTQPPPTTLSEFRSPISGTGDTTTMMHMTFYWGRSVTLLFDSWKTDSWLSYTLTLIACLIFSVFYQYMEDRRLRLKLLSTSAVANNTNGTVDATPLLNTKVFTGSRWSVGRFAGAVLFGINSAIGYFLMLAIMSFNGGVFVAIVVGLAVGYLLFRSGDDEQVVVVDNPCACA
ncbi:hypothetical protein R6Q59_023235 [Mikania micrantha]